MPNYDRYIKSTEEELEDLTTPQRALTPESVPTGLVSRDGRTYTIDIQTGNLVPLGVEYSQDLAQRRITEESTQRRGEYGRLINTQLASDIEEERRSLASELSTAQGQKGISVGLGFSSAEGGYLQMISDASKRRVKDLERSASNAISNFNLTEYTRAKDEISKERELQRNREETIFSRLLKLKETKATETTQMVSDLVSANLSNVPTDEIEKEKFYTTLAATNNLDVNSVKSAFETVIAKSKTAEVSTDISINNLLRSIPKTETITIGDKTYQGLQEPSVDTQVVEADGIKKLINSKTGEVIKNLGYSASSIANLGKDIITDKDGTEQNVQYIDSKTGKLAKMPLTQAEAISSFNSSISAIEKAKGIFMDEVGNFKLKTGPIQYRIYKGAVYAGTAKTEEVEFDALLSQVKANFMKAISGAAVSESEVKRLSKFLPEMSDQESVLAVKLGTLANALRNQKISLLNTTGIKEVGGQQVQQNSLDDIAEQKGFNIEKARNSGYSEDEIKTFLDNL